MGSDTMIPYATDNPFYRFVHTNQLTDEEIDRLTRYCEKTISTLVVKSELADKGYKVETCHEC